MTYNTWIIEVRQLMWMQQHLRNSFPIISEFCWILFSVIFFPMWLMKTSQIDTRGSTEFWSVSLCWFFRLSVQCVSWTRRCALAAPRLTSFTPPSLRLHLRLNQRRGCTSTTRSPETDTWSEGLPASHSLCPRLRPDPSRWCVPLLPLNPTSSSAPCRSAPTPGRFCPLIVVLHLTPGEQFPLWKLDELLESCEQVGEESWGSGRASLQRPEKERLEQSCGW